MSFLQGGGLVQATAPVPWPYDSCTITIATVRNGVLLNQKCMGGWVYASNRGGDGIAVMKYLHQEEVVYLLVISDKTGQSKCVFSPH